MDCYCSLQVGLIFSRWFLFPWSKETLVSFFDPAFEECACLLSVFVLWAGSINLLVFIEESIVLGAVGSSEILPAWTLDGVTYLNADSLLIHWFYSV